ncbi:hypothetical protein [Agathobaculum sp. Marseille-P7918]|uniref:hypothetical protein n=1 Tax=Agathobaculum sp. Marseille-P7918 TaxID=2479843 RepID=UPI0035632C87
MRAEEIRPVDLTTGTGYDSQWALMQDLLVWLDLQLFERCGLDAFEQNCVILTYAAVLDRK